MKKNIFSLATGVLSLGVSFNLQAAEKPNIIFFLVDDMGWLDSTPYGSQYYETPNMERLTKQGMLFTSAYACPFSSPTRASIMTGRYPERFQITLPFGHLVPNPEMPLIEKKDKPWKKMVDANVRHYLPLEEITIPEKLKEVGYATCHIGKWHLGHREYWPDKQGFDTIIATGDYPGPPSYFAPYHIQNFKERTNREYITNRLTDESITYIEKHQNTPFYLNLWHYAVHSPFQGPLGLIEKYKNKTDPRGKQNCAIMGAMIESMDNSLGRIMDKLEELNMTKNTIIVFVSDNGGDEYDIMNGIYPTNNDPLRYGKGNIHEGGVRVPCIISWPGKIAPNTKSDKLVSTNDFFPTFMSLTGVKMDKAKPVDGESILPLLFDKGKMKRKAIFTHLPHFSPDKFTYPSTSVRTKDWKLIRVYGEGKNRQNAFELYRINDDIGEGNNLADKYPKLVKKLDALIEAHIKSTGATVPILNPTYDPKVKNPMGIQPEFNNSRFPSFD